MRYLVNKRTSIWKFEPTTNEARDNELTATSDSDCGGCVETRKEHNWNRAQIRQMHDSDIKQNARMHLSELGRS